MTKMKMMETMYKEIATLENSADTNYREALTLYNRATGKTAAHGTATSAMIKETKKVYEASGQYDMGATKFDIEYMVDFYREETARACALKDMFSKLFGVTHAAYQNEHHRQQETA